MTSVRTRRPACATQASHTSPIARRTRGTGRCWGSRLERLPADDVALMCLGVHTVLTGMIRAAAKMEILKRFAQLSRALRPIFAAARQFFRRLAHQRQIMRKSCETSSKCTA